MAKSEPKTAPAKQRVRRNLISGAEFYDFEEHGKIFAGSYHRPVIREKDGPNVANNPNEKAGTIMGYLFTQFVDFDTPEERAGQECIIGASEQITRAMEKAKEGDIYVFEYLGKTQNSKGQPVNRFRIDMVEELPG